MPLQKPRVQASVGSLTTSLTWDAVQGATAYRIHYTLHNDPTKISQLWVRQTTVTIINLLPATNYTAFVSCVNVTHPGPPTIVYFKTTSITVAPSVGSGDELYPTQPLSEYSAATGLLQTTTGYAFGPPDVGLFIFSDFYKFATFSAGEIVKQTHLSLEIADPTGEWSLNGSVLENTVLQVQVLDQTGWLNANALHVAGVQDFESRGRVLTRSTNPSVRNITFGHTALSGTVLVRLGMNAVGDRQLSGVRMASARQST